LPIKVGSDIYHNAFSIVIDIFSANNSPSAQLRLADYPLRQASSFLYVGESLRLSHETQFKALPDKNKINLLEFRVRAVRAERAVW